MRNKIWPSGTTCVYCGSTIEIQIDHRVPQVLNGYDELPACRRCNQSKHSSTPAKWLDRIIQSSRPQDKYRWEAIRKWNYKRSNWFARLVHNRE